MPKNPAYPYVHVGHGVSAARKWWLIGVVLRDRPDARVLEKIRRPAPLDALSIVGTGFAVHTSSLQSAVASTYRGAGPRADKGEPTAKQWQAFNADVDRYLARVHAKFPIAFVIRTVDAEYSTILSAWHAWSCRELPEHLPMLEDNLAEPYLDHALALWRSWLATQPVADQKETLASLSKAARAVVKQHGGVPKVVVPVAQPIASEKPTLDAMRTAWAAIKPRDNAIKVFRAAFEQAELLDFVDALAAAAPAHDALLVEVAQRGLKTPGCRWADNRWRPVLVEALVRLGRIDEARAEVAGVVTTANSYLDGNWVTMIRYLDASKRRADADVIYRAASRYVAAFKYERKNAGKGNQDRAAALLLELAAPALASLDKDLASHVAYLFEDLANEGVAGEALVVEAARIREPGVPGGMKVSRPAQASDRPAKMPARAR